MPWGWRGVVASSLSALFSLQSIGCPGSGPSPPHSLWVPQGQGAQEGAFQASLLSACWQVLGLPLLTPSRQRGSERELGCAHLGLGIYTLQLSENHMADDKLVLLCLLNFGGAPFFSLVPSSLDVGRDFRTPAPSEQLRSLRGVRVGTQSPIVHLPETWGYSRKQWGPPR